MALLLVFLIAVSGCIAGDEFRKGFDALKSAAPSREQVEKGLFCSNAAFAVTSASWSNGELSVVIENNGNRDLSGFDITARSARGIITTGDGKTIAQSLTGTIIVSTADRPDDVTVASTECPSAKDTAIVISS
ncbi:MAG: hypothetical protein HY366_01625 [Candidatus Aenigmarchaeota archaeon]|nr:hypothetical protein [Candidatus Aenigmarchaeota archaeon]